MEQQKFLQEWDPHLYLKTFFTKAGPDTYKTLEFIQKELKEFKRNPVDKLLDFGSGPIVIVSLAATPYARQIHLADYLPANLMEIQKWIDDDISAFNWNPYIADILKNEGVETTLENINQRAKDLRTKALVFKCDAALENPLIDKEVSYPLILSIFCADSATSSKETWRQYMRNILSLIAPKGKILVAALRNCTFYHVGNRVFPSANINEIDFADFLIGEGFPTNDFKIEVCNVPECKNEGFDSMMFVKIINNR